MVRHELAHPLDGGEPNVAPSPELRDEILVVQRKDAELTLGHLVRGAERFDFADKVHRRMMGEISPTVKTRRAIFRESRSGQVSCDISPMTKIEAIREAIEQAMREKGFSKRSLSKAAELSESAVRDVMSRTDNPGIGTLTKIAEALELPVDQLTGAALKIPVLGKIGAGGEVVFSVDPDDELRDFADLPTVPRPPLVAGRLMALSVKGDSMLPKYEDGDVIYVRRDHDGVLPQYLGRYCAVRTADGGTWLKILSPGTEADRYTLRSLNAADMENVEVIWAAPVLFTMPKPV